MNGTGTYCQISNRDRDIMSTKFLIRIIKWLLFPWRLFWIIAGYLPNWFVSKHYLHKGPARLLRFSIYTTLFFPLSLFLIIELSICVNEMIIGQQADYRLVSDGFADYLEGSFPQLGPPVPEIPPVDRNLAGREAYYQYLVELYSPVIFQKVANHPEWDMPVFVDFDGNMNPRDNLNSKFSSNDLHIGIYGEVTEETKDSYYLTYSLYHVKDYDHPMREYLSTASYHDGDNEGFHLRVDKKSMQVMEVETWFHNIFLLYNRTGESSGTEPVQGPIYLENGTHVLVYVQPQGHGVRLMQKTDIKRAKKNMKVMRFVASRPEVFPEINRKYEDNITYRLKNFDNWYLQAAGPFDQDGDLGGTSLFSCEIPIGRLKNGEQIRVGKFIAGINCKINTWVRPKPMWSWDDPWDDIPIAVWHFIPSMSIESHSGIELSHRYLYNRPIEKIFHRTADEMMPYFCFEEQQPHQYPFADVRVFKANSFRVGQILYWTALSQWFKRYVSRVSGALG